MRAGEDDCVSEDEGEDGYASEDGSGDRVTCQKRFFFFLRKRIIKLEYLSRAQPMAMMNGEEKHKNFHYLPFLF